ncbi:MAG: MFS transporter, partial [Terracoccus sp.]
MSTSTPNRSPAPDSKADRAFFGQPKGLATLFFVELWERFSYYGMRAILLYFLIGKVADGGLGIDKTTGTAVV